MGGGIKTGRITRRDIAQAESLPALIQQLVKRIHDGTSDLKEHSVSALKNIALQHHGEDIPEVIKAGAVKPLVELLKGGSSDAQYNACATLAEIARNRPEVQASIVEAGGVAPIVRLLRMGGSAVQEQAASALASLSHDVAHQKQVIKAVSYTHLTLPTKA